MSGFIFSTYQSRMNLLLKTGYTPITVVRLVTIFNCFAYEWAVSIPDTTLLSFASVLSDRELHALIEKLLIKSVM
jgi:hypothetical protein